MASYTPNYNLKKPADSDYYDIADDNGNMDKIDTALNTLNAKSTPVSITNQYSTILAAINAYRTQKTYPFCIQKSGSSAVTDMPSSFPASCEWNVICIGDAQRTTAMLTIYTGGGSKNIWTYKANIFNGEIIRDWYSLDEEFEVNIGSQAFNVTPSDKVSLASGFVARKSGNVVVLSGVVQVGNDGLSGSGDLVLTIAESARPSVNQALRINATYNGTPGWYTFMLQTDGKLSTSTGASTFAANSNIIFDSVVYIV